MSAEESSIAGITTVSLPELVAMRARASKPAPHAAPMRGPLTGGHRSALRGRGMDYAESRIYQPGDDVRHIDWRRTARSGEWHTKLYEEEREQSLLVMIDTHPTMRFGTRVRYKSVAAARAAAWLAWTSVRAGDRVGALAFGAVRGVVDPRGGVRGALAVIGALARWDADARRTAPAGRHDDGVSSALQRARYLLPAGAKAMLLSDGWCSEPGTRMAMARLARRVDLRVGIIVDALEHDPAPAGNYVFETPSGRQRVDLSGTRERARFRDRLAAGSRRLQEACDAVGAPCVVVESGVEPDLPMRQLWRRPGRRR